MLRDLLIGGMLGVTLWGWRTYRATVLPENGQDGEQPQDAAQKLQSLQKQLSRTQKELAVAVAKRAEAETQVSELNQLATDRAIELVQLQADSAALLAQVAQLSQKRPRKKRVSKTDAPATPIEGAPKMEVQPVLDSVDSGTDSAQPLALDLSAIGRKQAEATAAAQLLQPIFTESHAPDTAPASEQHQSAIATVGLDETHLSFLRVLSQQSSWNRETLVEIAQASGLLLDGVLEVINDAAIDRCDEALTEGDDPIELNPDVLQELLS
jgi:TerB-C domain